MAFATLAVSLTARIKSFSKGMRRARRELATFRKAATRAMVRSGKRIATFGLAAGAAMGAFGAKMIGTLDGLAFMAKRLGIATEKLAALRHAAALSGNNVATLDMGLQRMTRRISEAAQGSGEAKDALKELGLNARELNNLPVDQQLLAVANAMTKVEKQGDKVRLSMRLFDSEGVALVNTLALIAGEGFGKVEAAAKKAGIAPSEKELERIQKIRVAWLELSAVIAGAATQLLVKYAPAIRKFIEGIKKSIPGAKDVIEQIKGAALTLVGVFKGIGKILQMINTGWAKLITFIKGSTEAMAAFVGTVVGKIQTFFKDISEGRIFGEQGAFGKFASGASAAEAFKERMAQTMEDVANATSVGPMIEAAMAKVLPEEVNRAISRNTGLAAVRRARMAGAIPSNVIDRAMSMSPNANATQLQRTTAGTTENLLPKLQRQIEVLTEIRDRIELGARAG